MTGRERSRMFSLTSYAGFPLPFLGNALMRQISCERTMRPYTNTSADFTPSQSRLLTRS